MATVTQVQMTEKLYDEGIRSGVYGSVPGFAIEDPSLGALEIALLAFLSASAAGKKHCYVKRSTVTSLLGISKTRFQKGLQNLVRNNYILLYSIQSRSAWYDPAHKVTLTPKAVRPSKRHSIVHLPLICSSLSVTAKALYVVLTCKADASDQVAPTVAYLSAMLQITENTLSKYMSELVAQGLIERDTKQRDNATHQFTPAVSKIIEKPKKIIPLPCPPSSATPKSPTHKNPSAKKRDSSYIKELSISKELPYGDKTNKGCFLSTKKTEKTEKALPKGAITAEMMSQYEAKTQDEYIDLCQRYPSQRIPVPTEDEISQLVADQIAQDTSFHGIGQIPAFERKHDLFKYLLANVDGTDESTLYVIRALEALLTQTSPIRLPDGEKITAAEFRDRINQKIIQNHWKSGLKPKSHAFPTVDMSALINTLEDYAERTTNSMEFNEVKSPIAYARAIILNLLDEKRTIIDVLPSLKEGDSCCVQASARL